MSPGRDSCRALSFPHQPLTQLLGTFLQHLGMSHLPQHLQAPMALLHCLAHQPCSPWQAEHQLRVQVQHELAPGKDLPRHSDVLKVQHLQPEVDTEANPLEMAGLAGPDPTVPSPPAHHLTCYLCGYSQLKMKVGKGQPPLQEPTSKQDQVAQSCVLLSLNLSLQGWRFLHLLGCPLQYHITP